MKSKSLIDTPIELLEFVDKSLKIKDFEKKEFGEVFTPIHLINKMFDKLPHDVWKNKDLKWLDFSCGIGNFPICIYFRLFQELKYVIDDDEKRKKHILENMLYMCELNKNNVKICKEIFDLNNEYKLNLYEGNSLIIDYEKQFGIDKFDIIVGNPPYNYGGIKSCSKKQLGEKNITIWPKFVDKSFELLKPNGYLVYITPLSWLKSSHSLHNILLEKYILLVELWDNAQSKKLINAYIPISLFILQNKLNVNNHNTDITTISKRRHLITRSNIYLDKDYSIPLAYHSIFNKLIHFIKSNNVKLEYKTQTVKSIGEKIKLPLHYQLEDLYVVYTHTVKDGIIVKQSNTKHIDADKRKLIIANKSSLKYCFIDDGKLGLSGSNKFYVLGDNLELILKMFNFKIVNIVGEYTKYNMDFLNSELFNYLPDLRKLGFHNIEENEFYKLIKFTDEEILFFNNI